MIKVNSREEAWKKANWMFPTDYEKDEDATTRAGYPIYRSTFKGNDSWISSLNDRLELNIYETSGKVTTSTIWIEEKEQAGMKATVRNINNEYKEYEINGIVNIQYVGQNLILTSMRNGEVATNMYNSADVIIEIH